MKSILVVLNPGAGTTGKEVVKEIIEDYFSSQTFSLSWYYTTGANDIPQLQELVKKTSPDIILACGGDGTCNLVAHAAISEKTTMAIIPLGSANALAKELNIPLNTSQAVDLVTTGKIKQIDYLIINDMICIRQAETGVNAQLIRSFEESPGRGMFRYVLHFVQNMFKWKSFSTRIMTSDSYLKKRHVISLTIATSTTFGTGAIINPTGSIDDGIFEVIAIRAFPWYSLPSLSIRLFTGKIHESLYTDVVSCREAQVSFRKKKLLQVDGELIGEFNLVKVSVVHKGLSILVP